MKEEQILELIEKAFDVQKMSYSPYSNFKVGAALLTKSGKIFMGTNVENAAYGPSNCAERSAVFSAVSSGEREFISLAVVGGDGTSFVTPCGVCRQVLNEFNPDIQIITAKKNGTKIEYQIENLSSLLPKSFGPKDLD